jgi:hypothetical protein
VPFSTVDDPFSWTRKVCRSASELLQTPQWSAGLSGGLGPIPLLKARQKFFESLLTTVYSVSVVVQALRAVAAMTCEDVVLKPAVPIPSDGAALDGFVDTYGDSWVRSVVVGGQMQGIYTLYFQSTEQAREVATALDLLVSTGTISLGPSFIRRLKTIAKDANMNVSCRISASGLAQPPAITNENMAAFARSFSTFSLDNPSHNYRQLRPKVVPMLIINEAGSLPPPATASQRPDGYDANLPLLFSDRDFQLYVEHLGLEAARAAVLSISPPDPAAHPAQEQRAGPAGRSTPPLAAASRACSPAPAVASRPGGGWLSGRQAAAGWCL